MDDNHNLEFPLTDDIGKGDTQTIVHSIADGVDTDGYTCYKIREDLLGMPDCMFSQQAIEAYFAQAGERLAVAADSFAAVNVELFELAQEEGSNKFRARIGRFLHRFELPLDRKLAGQARIATTKPKPVLPFGL